jgi:signal transduction histidine kinase/CheY-like chemotaxis protein
MTELATLRVRGPASILDARSKMLRLGRDVGLDEIRATRLAAGTSEAARRLAANGRIPQIRLGLSGDALQVRFEGWVAEPETASLQPFFDSVEPVVQDDGTWSVVASLAAQGTFEEEWVARQRERLQRRSRSELMEDLRRHSEKLEETVAERTAQLEGARESAEQANRAKSQFLSNMSHELRTPLNGVLGYAQILLRDPTLGAEQRESLTAIENCGRHLLTLINDVLDLSKIEAGSLELDYAPCDLARLVRSVFDIVRPRAEKHGLAFVTDVSEGLPPAISTDATKLKQVLVNLLGNSVKFTSEGSVTLRVAADADFVRFDVIDTGIGMTPEEQASIFDPFKQAEGGKTSGGTGLGLSISKRIVEAMGGTVEVQSEKGKGTHFVILVPLEVADVEGLDEEDRESLAGDRTFVLAPGQDVTVLVADDNEHNRAILVRLLGDAGFKTVQANDGQEAIDRLREQKMPIVLMDIRMPGMDGDEATRVIRGDPELAGAKVVAVSASVFPDFREQLSDVGFDEFISKPLRAEEVFHAIERLLGVVYADEDAPRPEPEEEAALEALPAELAHSIAGRLRAATEIGDIDAVADLAQEVEEHAPAMAGAMARMARSFELGGLETLAAELEAVK